MTLNTTKGNNSFVCPTHKKEKKKDEKVPLDPTGKNLLLHSSSNNINFNFPSLFFLVRPAASLDLVIPFTSSRYMATTFSAAAYARKIFPCFDEPSFKSTFNLSVTNQNYYITLANTEQKSVEIADP